MIDIPHTVLLFQFDLFILGFMLYDSQMPFDVFVICHIVIYLVSFTITLYKETKKKNQIIIPAVLKLKVMCLLVSIKKGKVEFSSMH